MLKVVLTGLVLLATQVALADSTTLECASRDRSVILNSSGLILAGEMLVGSGALPEATTRMAFEDPALRGIEVASLEVLKLQNRKQRALRGGSDCDGGYTEGSSVDTYTIQASVDTARGYSISSIELTCTETVTWSSTCSY